MSFDRIYKILTADPQWGELNPQPPQTVVSQTLRKRKLLLTD